MDITCEPPPGSVGDGPLPGPTPMPDPISIEMTWVEAAAVSAALGVAIRHGIYCPEEVQCVLNRIEAAIEARRNQKKE